MISVLFITTESYIQTWNEQRKYILVNLMGILMQKYIYISMVSIQFKYLLNFFVLIKQLQH